MATRIIFKKPIYKEKLEKELPEVIIEKPNEIVDSESFKKGAKIRNIYIKLCEFKYKRKVKIVGRNLLSELGGKGPIIVLGTHHLTIEPAIIQSFSKNYVHWISAAYFPNSTSTKKYYFQQIPFVRKLFLKLETIPIDKQHVTIASIKQLLAKGTKLLEGNRIVGSFPAGHSDLAISTKIPDQFELGHSSILQMASKAQDGINKKIPVVLVSIRKNKRDGKYYVIQQLRYLPKKFDRKELINEYIREIEQKYTEMEKLESREYNPMKLLSTSSVKA
ncbi:MAG: hypothetical protein WCX82_03905 [archaeon]|jgi:hypothetical protein